MVMAIVVSHPLMPLKRISASQPTPLLAGELIVCRKLRLFGLSWAFSGSAIRWTL